MFSSSAPILRRLNAGRASACQNENLKCSVNCCIVCFLVIYSTTMTEQDKTTILDALIKPFLHSGALMHVVKSNATPKALPKKSPKEPKLP